MISKELLDAVLSIDSKLEIEYDDGNVKFYITPKANSKGYYEQQDINIHELAHKCKEWALSNGAFEIFSGIEDAKDRVCILSIFDVYDVMYFRNNDTEPEAIFKACEWMLIKHDKNREN